MAHKLENKNRYTVYTSENCYSSGIEAANAQEAIEKANKYRTNKEVYAVIAKPIFEAGIDVETDDGSDDDEGIFEIVVRGTSKEKVDALKHALGLVIPGPHTECDEDEEEFPENEVGNPTKLLRALRNLCVTGY